MMELWKRQAVWVRAALLDCTPVPLEALFIPRSSTGSLARKMEPQPGMVPREAAVLLLLYPHESELWFPLTVRSSRLEHHRGEVSLPGGATDPDDDSPVATALRETHEELGIDPTSIEIWGRLSNLYIPVSNFRLTPIVGFVAELPDLVPCSYEIAEVFGVPLSYVQRPEAVVVEEWVLGQQPAYVPFFLLRGYKVWGATAIVVSELLVRIARLRAG